MKWTAFVSLVILLFCFLTAGDLFAAEITIAEEFEVEKGKKLDIEIESGGSLEIIGWNKEKISVVVEIDGRHAEDVIVDFDETSSGLEIHSYFDNRKNNRKVDIDFEIKVPDKLDIRIDSNGGGVVIEGVEGDFKGKTMGGSIKLEKLKGIAHLETMGGSIYVSDSELDGRVKTMGGSVHIEGVVGDLEGSTMGGNVTYKDVSRGKGKEDDEVRISTMGGDIEVDRAGKKVSVKTHGGDIDVMRSDIVEATTMGGDIDVAGSKKVDVSTMGGDINVEEAPGGAKVKTMGGDITIGSAGEYVKATTMGGDIDIEEIDGWIEAKTMGGDVTVTMVGDPDKGRRDVEITSMGGDIELEVPDGLSMEFDIELAYTKDAKKEYKIVSDFDMKLEKTKEWERDGGTKKKYIYGTGEIKGGKNLIRIKTTNGNIYIRKGR